MDDNIRLMVQNLRARVQQTVTHARFASPAVETHTDTRTVGLRVAVVSAPSVEQRGDLWPSVVEHNNHSAKAAAAAAGAWLQPLTNR